MAICCAACIVAAVWSPPAASSQLPAPAVAPATAAAECMSHQLPAAAPPAWTSGLMAPCMLLKGQES